VKQRVVHDVTVRIRDVHANRRDHALVVDPRRHRQKELELGDGELERRERLGRVLRLRRRRLQGGRGERRTYHRRDARRWVSFESLRGRSGRRWRMEERP
jgi:hypothetical protein